MTTPAPADRPNWRQRGYDGTYDRNRARVLREEFICHICGHPVDKNLSGRDRNGPTVDHLVPRSLGGTNTRDNLRLAHLGCNSSKRSGARPTRKRDPEAHPGAILP